MLGAHGRDRLINGVVDLFFGVASLNCFLADGGEALV
jgi:hypothetical protein